MKKNDTKLIMTKGIVTISWNAHMAEAAELLEERRFRHLPVVDDMGVIVGILSDRDVNRAMSPVKPGFTLDSQVSDFMSWPVITIDENLPLKQVAQGMIDEKISAFLVTNAQKAIVGIITSEDLLKVLVGMLSGQGPLASLTYSPLVGEFLREAQSAGL